MPAADTVLLPLAVGLTLVGVLVVVLSARRGRRGRVLQGLALALLPAALYLTGLLRLAWDAVVAVVRWAGSNAFDLAAWVGFGVLGLSIVLWIAGGVIARRSPKPVRARAKEQGQVASGAGSTRSAGTKAAPTRQPVEQDDDMAEIEALLKSRGIQ